MPIGVLSSYRPFYLAVNDWLEDVKKVICFLGANKKPHQLSESSFMLKLESWWGHLMKVTQVGGGTSDEWI